MFLRWATTTIDADSHRPQGVFYAANALLESGDLSLAEREQMIEIMEWFNENLPVPKDKLITSRATFWFRSSASECVSRMWQLTNLLRAHGVVVELHKRQGLGNCPYGDSFQVASFPSAWDSPTVIDG